MSEQKAALARMDLFAPKDRQIFSYFTGKKEGMRDADPIELRRNLAEVGAELDVDIQLSVSEHSEWKLGYEGALKKIRKAFDVLPVREGGLNEDETFGLLYAFMAYVDSVKKNMSPIVTPTTATSASTASPYKPSAASPTMNPTSAFGSTAAVPPTDAAGPWRPV